MYSKSHLISFGNYLLKTYGVRYFSSDGKNTPLETRQVSHADTEGWKDSAPADAGTPLALLPSRYKHNDPVYFLFGQNQICATIHAIHFTVSKVKYDLDLFTNDGTDQTRIYNIDSAYVTMRKLPPQE